ncbi:MAG TPA: SOS response-associated peptidase [Thermoanaerobaculaceae bacterium]|nr:SOS response-associated peptidase [Thermoanaerobaculaceae bacterium]HRS15033.1 SOS response-associated peptidase [Thermoanaerobaculaceae bacterium]
MCGRYTLASPGNVVAEVFGLDEVPELRPRYNIAPAQDVVVVRAREGRRELATVRWGLVPAWAKDLTIGHKLINARAETLAAKPAFRAALRARRCLVVADGFYEWQPTAGRKQPWYFQLSDGRPFALAGLWERWQAPGIDPLESCAIVTTEANELVAPVHGRMPAILSPEGSARWLAGGPAGELRALLVPFPSEKMRAHPVSLRVNSPVVDDRGCIEPIAG